MKRIINRIIIAALICVLTLMPSIALSRPLNETGEPPYDPPEHSYEGKICWTTEFSYNDDRLKMIHQICVMDLATGEIKRAEIPENIYLVYTDEYKGVLLAQETDGVVTLYNWMGGDEYTKLFSYKIDTGTHYSGGNGFVVPRTVLAYMNGNLYYLYSAEEGREVYLRRVNLSSGETLDYPGSFYPNSLGRAAIHYGRKTDSFMALKICAPDIDKVVEISPYTQKGRYNCTSGLIGWLSDDIFLFWAYDQDEGYKDAVMMFYDISTNVCGIWLNDKGEIIQGKPFALTYYNLCPITINPRYFIGMKSMGDIIFNAIYIIDIVTGEQTVLYESKVTDEYTEWTDSANRVVWIYE